MIIRLAKLSDSITLFNWRNNSLSRKMSLNSRRIPWNTHSEWFKNALLNQDIIILIGQIEDTKSYVPYVKTSNGKHPAGKKVIDEHTKTSNANNLLSVGVIRFNIDRNNQSSDLSLIIDPKFRGIGLASKIIRCGILYLQSICPELTIIATVKKSNKPALAYTASCGFRVVKETTTEVELDNDLSKLKLI